MEKYPLSLKDKKILSIIETDGRLSYSEIGKKVGLSKQIVKYRINLLEKKDIIQEYYAIINDSRLGREVYFIYLQLTSLSLEDEKKLINSLKKEKKILSYFSSVGNWDFVLASFAKNQEELYQTLQKILKPISSKIKNKVITSQGELNYLPTKIFSNLGNKITSTKLEEKENIDELDLKIITQLLSKGRSTLVELAEKYKMSANGIKDRIKNLEKKKIIVGYKTKINYELLGFLHAHLFIWAKNMNTEFYNKFKDFLINDGRTEAISRSFGYADIDFRCNVRSIGELYDLKRKIKNNFKEEINSVESLIVVRSGISHLKN